MKRVFFCIFLLGCMYKGKPMKERRCSNFVPNPVLLMVSRPDSIKNIKVFVYSLNGKYEKHYNVEYKTEKKTNLYLIDTFYPEKEYIVQLFFADTSVINHYSNIRIEKEQNSKGTSCSLRYIADGIECASMREYNRHFVWDKELMPAYTK
jgi:hypothetical protein